MGLKLIEHGSKEYQDMLQLRYLILRQPIGLNYSEEELEKEKDNILIAAYDDDKMLGCCMLVKKDRSTLQLRQMAVQNNLQGKGIGASIMSFAESIARDKGFSKIIMHSRKTAVGFYEKFGFRVVGPEFTEINLPHFQMEKMVI